MTSSAPTPGKTPQGAGTLALWILAPPPPSPHCFS